MLREGMLHVDWGEMTMSMMREKQFEACERRLFAYPSVGLFSQEATELDAMRLLSGSFEKTNDQMLTTLSELRRLPAYSGGRQSPGCHQRAS